MASASNSTNLDFNDILSILRRRKWFIIIPVIIVTAIAYTGIYFLTPVYQSSTVIWIDRPSNVSRELASIIGERRESREEQQSRQIALRTELTSQKYMSELIREKNLSDDEDIIREATKLKNDIPGLTIEQIASNLLIKSLRENISVQFNSSDQFRIIVESEDPTLSRDIANSLARILEREKAKYELERILDNQDFTDMQLQRAEYDYKEAVDSLNAARAKLATFQLPENITSESNRIGILSAIDKTELDISDYYRESQQIEQQLRDNNLFNESIKYSNEIVDIESDINVMIASYARNLKKYSWDDQNVINVNIRLNEKVKQLESALEDEIEREYSSLPLDQKTLLKRKYIITENTEILASKKKRLEQSLEEIDALINRIPQLESEISEWGNRVESARVYRDAFRTEETTVGILSERVKERTKYKVIESAQLPLAPSWPQKDRLIIFGFIFGIVIGGAFVVLLELLDNSIKRIEDIEEEFGLPVLAAIPKIDKLKARK